MKKKIVEKLNERNSSDEKDSDSIEGSLEGKEDNSGKSDS
jgi:hypothetical protein